ncbi:FtsX-like permease family protein [Sulfitobacter sp. F26204]|uniref:ABC transporter permease n=1 Tax=Sulfitobacter sp. F26204 TaxID=2996014 RepID=UPI00225E096B|nr:FtsX-like permease family protein [Sulfitobacter sp. F26204]MCX7560547.1 FtsX-like permease family protein [Sulfitobacter sp. F26204]
MKWFAHALRNVLRNRRRTLMASTVVAIGTTAMAMTLCFMLATFFGLGESTIRADVGHIQITTPGSFDADTDIANGLTPTDQDHIAQVLAGTEGVRFSMRRILFDGLTSKGESTIAIVGRGVEPLQEMRLSGIFAPITRGQLMSVEGTHFEALIGERLAQKLEWAPRELLTLVGTTESGSINAVDVLSTGAYSTGVPEKDARAVMVPLHVAAALLDTENVSRVVVVLDDTADTDLVRTRLQSALPELEVRDWRQLDPFYEQVVTLYSNIFGILCLIIVLVVLMSVSNTMMMTVMERIREIGTLRAIGFSKFEMRIGFSIEGALIGLMGALIGLALAAVLSFAINVAGVEMPPAPGRTAPYPLIFFIDLRIYAGVAMVMVLSGVLGVIWPSRKGTSLPIVEALGHD